MQQSSIITVSASCNQSKPRLQVERMELATPVLEEALRLNPNSVVIRMNALLLAQTRLENDAEASMEAAIEHANWFSKRKPDNAQVWGKLHELHHILAERKLIDPSRIKNALERSQNPSGTPISRFLDPLYAGDND